MNIVGFRDIHPTIQGLCGATRATESRGSSVAVGWSRFACYTM
jgi:hypothetical protein